MHNSLTARKDKIKELQLLIQLDPTGGHESTLREFLLTPHIVPQLSNTEEAVTTTPPVGRTNLTPNEVVQVVDDGDEDGGVDGEDGEVDGEGVEVDGEDGGEIDGEDDGETEVDGEDGGGVDGENGDIQVDGEGEDGGDVDGEDGSHQGGSMDSENREKSIMTQKLMSLDKSRLEQLIAAMSSNPEQKSRKRKGRRTLGAKRSRSRRSGLRHSNHREVSW